MKLFTDGACDNYKTLSGGYAFVVVDENDIVYEDYGSLRYSSAFYAEVTAIIKGLIWCELNKPGEKIEVYCDSPVLVAVIKSKLQQWIRSNTFKRVMNKSDILSFRHLYNLLNRLDVTLIPIKRESSIFNSRANYLARLGKDRAKLGT